MARVAYAYLGIVVALVAAVALVVAFWGRIDDLPWFRAHASLDLVPTHVGAVYTLTGTTPHHRHGAVEVTGSWDGGPWLSLGSTTTATGDYAVRFRIRRAGTLTLRVTFPGGDASGTLVATGAATG